ncbi:MAG TPA: aldo/keto reductase [Flavilitoribacter sp.]|nr:aldo/keto reductase [Flavilitoribacter sp.]
MQRKKLGKSALQPTIIGLGCMSFHTLETGRPVIEKALDLGINYFDTADLYDKGENERIVGTVLKPRRKDVIIATKVGNQWRNDGSSWDWNPGKDYIKTAVHDSLRRLQTDYIDLYQLHGGTIDDPTDETIEAFEELVQTGHIRHYGISSIRPNTIRRWTASSNLVSVMTQYSLLDTRPEEFTLGHIQGHEVGVVVRGAVAGGLLAGKPPKEYLAHKSDTVSQVVRRQKELLQVAKGFEDLWENIARHDQPKGGSEKGNHTPEPNTLGQIALAYVLQHPAVTTIALGAGQPQQLDIVRGLEDLLPLDPAVYQKLKAAAPSIFYTDHR